jgi:hypothetical protein
MAWGSNEDLRSTVRVDNGVRPPNVFERAAKFLFTPVIKIGPIEFSPFDIALTVGTLGWGTVAARSSALVLRWTTAQANRMAATHFFRHLAIQTVGMGVTTAVREQVGTVGGVTAGVGVSLLAMFLTRRLDFSAGQRQLIAAFRQIGPQRTEAVFQLLGRNVQQLNGPGALGRFSRLLEDLNLQTLGPVARRTLLRQVQDGLRFRATIAHGNFGAPSVSEFAHVKDSYTRLANQQAASYDRLIRQRMQQLGIPTELAGVDQARGRIFNPNSIVGGSVDQLGIELDAAILMPTRMGRYAPSWRTATVQERIDAVLVHEFVEHQFAVAAGRDVNYELTHQLAVQFGPQRAREMGVSGKALRILEEMASHR